MRPVMLWIRQMETGERIRALMQAQGYTVKDIQIACGFENPQSVYRWIRGDSLPSVEKLLILSRILRTDIEELLVVEEKNVVLERDRENRKHGSWSQEEEWEIAC